jgi:hypothetical protein
MTGVEVVAQKITVHGDPVWKRREYKERKQRGSNLRLKAVGVTTTSWGCMWAIKSFESVP